MSSLTVEYAIRKYGSPINIGENKTRALLRPLRKTQENGEEYWCAAPAGSGLTPGEKVCWGEKHLVVLRGDGAFLGGKKLYDWAVLREEQGAFSGG